MALVVSNPNYHIAFCSKYCRKVLIGAIKARLKELLHEKAAELGVEITLLEIMPDYVHLAITAPLNDTPQHLVNPFKDYTSRALGQEFPELKRRLSPLWSRSYYLGKAGAVTEDVIRRYREKQNK